MSNSKSGLAKLQALQITGTSNSTSSCTNCPGCKNPELNGGVNLSVMLFDVAGTIAAIA